MPGDRRPWSEQRMDSTRRDPEGISRYHIRPFPNCTAGPDGDNLYQWVCSITGNFGSVYEGGVLFLDLSLPYSYLLQPPSVNFRTKIYHCNIRNSMICLDIL
ncbi:Ubiquitin conjugating enzyme E2 [Operophtera brumata]|uniref:Ubiquitin conjugating enzyme E2 n=1 Tax=Operophtera brumata TaxID=104452 RepID=A0A0L7KNY2_OPEBR|nr:Ubiquitin conjugating enzyme E2 [Operophtera brumata]